LNDSQQWFATIKSTTAFSVQRAVQKIYPHAEGTKEWVHIHHNVRHLALERQLHHLNTNTAPKQMV
jgi:hypothetical protein